MGADRSSTDWGRWKSERTYGKKVGFGQRTTLWQPPAAFTMDRQRSSLIFLAMKKGGLEQQPLQLCFFQRLEGRALEGMKDQVQIPGGMGTLAYDLGTPQEPRNQSSVGVTEC